MLYECGDQMAFCEVSAASVVECEPSGSLHATC